MRTLILVSTMLLTASCSQKTTENKDEAFNHIVDPQVREVLKKAIDYGGGYDRWQSLKKVKYRKKSLLILEDGSEESYVDQIHSYQMNPAFEAEITWQQDSSQHQISYNSTSAAKYVDGVDGESDPEGVSRTVMSALFVLGMPYKLLDPGVNLSYQGRTMFMDSAEADIIQASYSPADNENHSTSDLWWFYFDPTSGHFLGSKVYHPPTYALIHNLSFAEEIPLKFPTRRKSYRTDSLGNIKFKRAEFWYSEFEVE